MYGTCRITDSNKIKTKLSTLALDECKEEAKKRMDSPFVTIANANNRKII